eukprot:RCo023761
MFPVRTRPEDSAACRVTSPCSGPEVRSSSSRARSTLVAARTCWLAPSHTHTSMSPKYWCTSPFSAETHSYTVLKKPESLGSSEQSSATPDRSDRARITPTVACLWCSVSWLPPIPATSPEAALGTDDDVSLRDTVLVSRTSPLELWAMGRPSLFTEIREGEDSRDFVVDRPLLERSSFRTRAVRGVSASAFPRGCRSAAFGESPALGSSHANTAAGMNGFHARILSTIVKRLFCSAGASGGGSGMESRSSRTTFSVTRASCCCSTSCSFIRVPSSRRTAPKNTKFRNCSEAVLITQCQYRSTGDSSGTSPCLTTAHSNNGCSNATNPHTVPRLTRKITTAPRARRVMQA